MCVCEGFESVQIGVKKKGELCVLLILSSFPKDIRGSSLSAGCKVAGLFSQRRREVRYNIYGDGLLSMTLAVT